MGAAAAVYNCPGLVPVLHDKYVNAAAPPQQPVSAPAAAAEAAAEECAVWGFRAVRRMCAASAAMCAGLDRAGLLDSLKRHILALPPFPERGPAGGERAGEADSDSGGGAARRRRRMGREAVRTWRTALCYGIRSPPAPPPPAPGPVLLRRRPDCDHPRASPPRSRPSPHVSIRALLARCSRRRPSLRRRPYRSPLRIVDALPVRRCSGRHAALASAPRLTAASGKPNEG